MSSFVNGFALTLVVLTLLLIGVAPLYAMYHRHEAEDQHENEF